MQTYASHYEYLNTNFQNFVNELPVSEFWKECCTGAIVGDGDKCYGYKRKWESAGVSFNHGAAIFLISKMSPYSDTVRENVHGWVDTGDWVIMKYETEFKEIFDRLEI